MLSSKINYKMVKKDLTFFYFSITNRKNAV